MYKLYVERAAERDLKRLSTENFHRLITEIKMLAKEPRPPGARKITGSKDDWRIRVGDWRVVYEIDNKQKVVRIMRVRLRREVYR